MNIKKYDIYTGSWQDEHEQQVDESRHGDWYKVEDVKKLMAELVGGMDVLIKDGRLCPLNLHFYLEQLREL